MSTPERPLAVVILAAGLGRRLGPDAAELPKWLVAVGDRRIADYQLDALEGCLVGTSHRVIVVAGHRRDELRAWLHQRNPTIAVVVLENARYAELNNWYSLFLALRHLAVERWPAAVAVVNSDLCARPEWYAHFLSHAGRGPSSELQLAVDFDRLVTPESMKVATRRDGSRRLCTAIGKVGVVDPAGEYVGLAGLGHEAWREKLLPVLEGFHDDEGRADEWYEAGFRALIDAGTDVVAWPTPDSDWVEVDDEEDLGLARRLMASR